MPINDNIAPNNFVNSNADQIKTSSQFDKNKNDFKHLTKDLAFGYQNNSHKPNDLPI